jgi:hypothetical protein
MRWAKMERVKKKLGDGVPAHLVFPTEIFTSDPSMNRRSVASASRPSTSATTESSLSKVTSHVPKSSFSLERPLFAIVEGPDDHVSGCFEFGSRRERGVVTRDHGRRRA